jgi:protein-S-isoprenylcysteine O-methyltransferase Ste14
MLKRVAGFTYGMLCYLIFFGTFLYAIGFVGGGNLYHSGDALVTPGSIDLNPVGTSEPLLQRIIIDALLLSLFAIQHSIMARQWFKKRWTKIVPPLLERSTYVLIASLTLLLLFWQWRQIGTERIAWSVQNKAGTLALETVFWLGWLIVLVSTVLINHFELFGLRQAYCYLKGTQCPSAAFKTPGFYRAVRHPLYLGFMLAFWSTPRMSLGHLFFAIMTTAYMIVAIQFEERDMIRTFGRTYTEYKEHVSMLAPVRIWKGPSGDQTRKPSSG